MRCQYEIPVRVLDSSHCCTTEVQGRVLARSWGGWHDILWILKSNPSSHALLRWKFYSYQLIDSCALKKYTRYGLIICIVKYSTCVRRWIFCSFASNFALFTRSTTLSSSSLEEDMLNTKMHCPHGDKRSGKSPCARRCLDGPRSKHQGVT